MGPVLPLFSVSGRDSDEEVLECLPVRVCWVETTVLEANETDEILEIKS